jgi:plasmid stabilization system protein ParE
MAEKSRRVVWAPRAKQDLRDIWRYYARVVSPDTADKLLLEIDYASSRLADHALMWRARDEVMVGLRAVLAHPYTIFYRVGDAVVEIVRVLHERRNFPEAFKEDQ